MAFGCFGGPCLGKGAVSRERTTAIGAAQYDRKIAAGSKTEYADPEESVAQGPLYEQPAPQGRRSGGTSEESPASQLEDMKTLPDQLQADGRSGKPGTLQGLDLHFSQAAAATTDPATSQLTEETATSARTPMDIDDEASTGRSGGNLLEERPASQMRCTPTGQNQMQVDGAGTLEGVDLQASQAVAATSPAAGQIPEEPASCTRTAIDRKGELDEATASSKKAVAAGASSTSEPPSQGALRASTTHEAGKKKSYGGAEGADGTIRTLIMKTDRRVETAGAVLKTLQSGATWLDDFARGLSIDPQELASATLTALSAIGKVVDVVAEVGEALPFVGAAFKLLKLVRKVVKTDMITDGHVNALGDLANVMEENLRELTQDVHRMLDRHVVALDEALYKAATFVTAYKTTGWALWFAKKFKRVSDDDLVKDIIQDIKNRWDQLAGMASLRALQAVSAMRPWPEVKFVPDEREEELRAELTPENLKRLQENPQYLKDMQARLSPSSQVLFAKMSEDSTRLSDQLGLILEALESKNVLPTSLGAPAACSEPDKQKLQGKALYGKEWMTLLDRVKLEIAGGKRWRLTVYGRSGSGMTTFCEQIKGSKEVLDRFVKKWKDVFFLHGIGHNKGQPELDEHCRGMQWELYKALEAQQERKPEWNLFPATSQGRKELLNVRLKDRKILLILDGVASEEEVEAFGLKTFNEGGFLLVGRKLNEGAEPPGKSFDWGAEAAARFELPHLDNQATKNMLQSTAQLKSSSGPYKELKSVLNDIVKTLAPCLPAEVEETGRRLQGVVDRKRWEAELERLSRKRAVQEDSFDAEWESLNMPSTSLGERLQTLFLLVAALSAVADPLVADLASFLHAWAASWDLELEDAERDIQELEQKRLLFRGVKTLSATSFPEIIYDEDDMDWEEEEGEGKNEEEQGEAYWKEVARGILAGIWDLGMEHLDLKMRIRTGRKAGPSSRGAWSFRFKSFRSR